MGVPGAADVPEVVWVAGILLTILGSAVAIDRLTDGNRRIRTHLSARFVFGVPWGSAIVVLGVLGFYLFAQSGLHHWYDPVTVPFTATSYRYPLGMLTAAFAHSSASHLTNNLLSTIVLAPLAEYVWGHYPESPAEQRWPTSNPYLRAFVLFPLGVLLVGVATALFAWGPVIGFSGVVFAFVGFALVKHPFVTIIAIVARSAAHVIRAAIANPVIVSEASSTFSRPSWAGTAVQGHALGLLLGIALAAVLLWYRGDRPDPWKLWIGSLLGGMTLSLWAFWWVRGSETYVLYRGAGVIFVFVLSGIITAALVASDRPLWGRLTYRQTAVLILWIPLLTMSLVAVPLNVNAVSVDQTDAGVQVGDYLIFYEEEVEDQMISVVDVSMFGETTNVTTNGVIVTSDERQLWRRAVSTAELAHDGRHSVVVGGIGWRAAVDVERRGWEPVGSNDSVYAVWFRYDGEEHLAYSAEPQTAGPIVANHTFTMTVEDGRFAVEAETPAGTVRTPVPDDNTTVELGRVSLHREADDLIVSHPEGTTVRIASVEEYER